MVPKPETPKPESSKPAPVSTPQAYPTKPADTPKPDTPKPDTPKPDAPKPDTPKPDTPKPDTPKPDTPKPNGGYSSTGYIKTNGDKWAITYTPYAKDGQCKTSADIQNDIKKISELGFTTIRSYSTDCGVFEYVVPACQQYKLKIIYGIFLEGNGKGTFSQHANDQLEAIKKSAPKDSVAMVIVGNECMFKGQCQPAELASYIDYVRKELQDCGFPKDVAVTTTEPVGTWEEKGAALCDHIDVFTVQVHPYFTKSVSADQAGDFAAQQLEQAAKVCPKAAAKGKYITEIGWPSAGNPNGDAKPGAEEQKAALKSIMKKVGYQSCLFSFQDDAWKQPGEYNVEQSFGCVKALS